MSSRLLAPTRNLLLVLLLSGCASDLVDWHGPAQWAGLADRHRLERSTDWLVSSNSRLYVAQPTNASFDAGLHLALVNAVSRYYPHSSFSQVPESLDGALHSAVAAGATLVIYPNLQRRVKSAGVEAVWAGQARIRDLGDGQFDLDIGIYTAVEGLKVDQVQFESLPGLFTNDEAELLWPPLDAYLRQISSF